MSRLAGQRVIFKNDAGCSFRGAENCTSAIPGNVGISMVENSRFNRTVKYALAHSQLSTNVLHYLTTKRNWRASFNDIDDDVIFLSVRGNFVA